MDTSESSNQVQRDQGRKVGPGKRLQVARQEKSWTVEQVAAKLNLRATIIESLENDQFESLDAPVYVRGYLRNYCKLLDINPAPVLEAYDLMVEYDADQSSAKLAITETSIPKSFSLKPVFLGVIVLLVVLFGYLWLTSVPGEVDHAQRNADADQEVIEEEFDSSGNGLPIQQSVPEDIVTEHSSPTSSEPDISEPLNDELTQNELIQDERAGVKEAPAVEEVQPEVTEELPPEVIAVRFTQDSWVDIRGVNRKKLAYGMKKAGYSIEIPVDELPVSFVIGNSKGVQIEYNGEPFDIGPYVRGNVAKFQIEK